MYLEYNFMLVKCVLGTKGVYMVRRILEVWLVKLQGHANMKLIRLTLVSTE